MNDEIKAEWVRRLRSGDYAQAIGVLGVPVSNQRCCLGVLCDIAVEQGVIAAPMLDHDPDTGDATLVYGGSTDLLPSSVKEWAGLRSVNPDVYWVESDGYEMQRDIADANDSHLDFAQIANLIEDQL